MVRQVAVQLAGVAIVLMLVGCGEKVDPNRPKTFPAGGIVTYKGQPVEGAMVTFSTESPGGRGAVGTTDATGKFELMTFKPRDGAVAGSYQVTVIKKKKVEGTPALVTPDKEAEAFKSEGTQTNDLLPVQYTDAKKSGLTAEVKSGGDNRFTFDLKD